MSGIHNPGIGDVLDRLMVLTRKIQEDPRDHWVEELTALTQQLPSAFSHDQVMTIIALTVANMVVWQETDDQNLAQRLFRHNRFMHELVEKLNADGREEKIK